jgi:hypothetical protein
MWKLFNWLLSSPKAKTYKKKSQPGINCGAMLKFSSVHFDLYSHGSHSSSRYVLWRVVPTQHWSGYSGGSWINLSVVMSTKILDLTAGRVLNLWVIRNGEMWLLHWSSSLSLSFSLPISLSIYIFYLQRLCLASNHVLPPFIARQVARRKECHLLSWKGISWYRPWIGLTIFAES